MLSDHRDGWKISILLDLVPHLLGVYPQEIGIWSKIHGQIFIAVLFILMRK